MGHLADYKCKKCGNIFESVAGGGFLFVEYRCVECDNIQGVMLKERNAKYTPPKKCSKCGGELKFGLKPMCPKCKSRDVDIIKVKKSFD